MASGLVNVGRMLGGTLGVAVLGSIFAVASRGAPTAEDFVAGARVALLIGAAAELLGCVTALCTIHARALTETPREVVERPRYA